MFKEMKKRIKNEKLDAIDISLYSKLISPSFSGTPTVPTAQVGDNSSQIANTAFVVKAITDALARITGIRMPIFMRSTAM